MEKTPTLREKAKKWINERPGSLPTTRGELGLLVGSIAAAMVISPFLPVKNKPNAMPSPKPDVTQTNPWQYIDSAAVEHVTDYGGPGGVNTDVSCDYNYLDTESKAPNVTPTKKYSFGSRYISEDKPALWLLGKKTDSIFHMSLPLLTHFQALVVSIDKSDVKVESIDPPGQKKDLSLNKTLNPNYAFTGQYDIAKFAIGRYSDGNYAAAVWCNDEKTDEIIDEYRLGLEETEQRAKNSSKPGARFIYSLYPERKLKL